jgi:hypothetical protein
MVTSKVPQPPPDQEAKWGPAIAEYLNKMEIPEPLHGIDGFAQALDPAEMEREILQENRLHDEIDKTIKRLAQVKAYKQLGVVARLDVNTPKLIEGSPNRCRADHPGVSSPRLKKSLRRTRCVVFMRFL